MASVLHGSARTTPRVRAELQASKESARALAARYGLNAKTVRKWRRRTTTADEPIRRRRRARCLRRPRKPSWISSPGQRNDIAFAHELIEGFAPDVTIANKGYDLICATRSLNAAASFSFRPSGTARSSVPMTPNSIRSATSSSASSASSSSSAASPHATTSCLLTSWLRQARITCRFASSWERRYLQPTGSRSIVSLTEFRAVEAR
jgi:hypothetical protein